MRRRFPLLLLGALACAGRPAGAAETGEVVARVGAIELKAADVAVLLAGLPPDQRAALAREPALIGDTLRQVLAARLVYREALAKKWDARPEVTAALDQARQNIVVESYLRAVAAPPENFPGADELARAYEANKASFVMPRHYRLAQIYLAVPKGADRAEEAAAAKKLDGLLARLAGKDADFAALAAEGADQAAGTQRNGEIGWVRDDALRPEIRAQVAGLAKDAVGEPIRLDDGWHVVKLLDTKAAYTRPLDEVRQDLIDSLRRERAAANAQAYLAALLQQHPAAINEIALSRLLANPGP